MDYLVSGLEMGELDRQTIEEVGVPGRVLMEVAGRAVAAAAAELLSPGGRVLVACGAGNNGGDGFVAARALAAAGYEVSVFLLGDPLRIKPDAKSALQALERSGGDSPISVVQEPRSQVAFAAALGEADVVVDGLLGTGAKSEVRGLLAEAIDLINQSRAKVVAVDIPSGVNADTGVVLGRAINADVTVTFAFAKRGHHLYPGAERCGEVRVVDIGIPHGLAERLPVVGRLLLESDGPQLLPPRHADDHKGTFGQVVVLAGSQQTPGAALLAVRAALRSGVGLTRWAADAATVAGAPSWPPEAMLLLRQADEGLEAWGERICAHASAIVAGPGLGTSEGRQQELRSLLAQARVPLCLDADGLNMLAENPDWWQLIEAPLVVTPHPKEMSRLTGQSVAEIQSDRFAAAMQLAVARGCVVVLKGAGTVIAEPDGVVSVAAVGNPGLATGGTGDVLAGLIGGLLAQGMMPSTAARLGVLLHGAAGDRAAAHRGQAGLCAGDVIDALGEVWVAWRR